MVLDWLYYPEKWDLINSELKKKLAKENHLRVYENPYLACFDTVIPLAQLFAHKRSVAFIKGVTPWLESIYGHFLKEGYQIQNFNFDQVQTDKDNLISFVEGLKKDTLFLFYPEDHPLTGEIFNFGDLENLLSHKKIYAISVKHIPMSVPSDKSFYPLSAQISYVDGQMTVVELGEKFKVNSLLGAYQKINTVGDTIKIVNELQRRFEENKVHKDLALKQEVEKLSSLNYDMKEKFGGVNYSYDRALLHFPTIHTDVLEKKLIAQGYTYLSSLASCSILSNKALQKWFTPELKKEICCQLLFLKFRNSKDVPSLDLLKNLVKEILEQSSWEI
ncbi:MAG: hypothetical protein L6Q37_06890 [Bdellovibrionaceae bacterium]|nr:hypothetical protein [Pseudobdellovibrionaceae bacterium]NUM57029.1 hypothetical protein [Pseudobdellovibrionaceae bacterium]